MRILSDAESFANLSTCFALSQYQSGGATSMRVEILQRFADAGALIMPVLADDVGTTTEMPDWLPLAEGGLPFIPRAYLVCFMLNKQGYDLACSGAALSELTPWTPADADAYALIVTVISQARNGVARLIIAFSERAEQHPCLPKLREVLWYTRTAKGQAMTQYFQGRETGRMITRTFANGKTQAMPLYTLTVKDWKQHADSMIEKLLGLEENFSDTLADVHKKLR